MGIEHLFVFGEWPLRADAGVSAGWRVCKVIAGAGVFPMLIRVILVINYVFLLSWQGSCLK